MSETAEHTSSHAGAFLQSDEVIDGLAAALNAETGVEIPYTEPAKPITQTYSVGLVKCVIEISRKKGWLAQSVPDTPLRAPAPLPLHL